MNASTTEASPSRAVARQAPGDTARRGLHTVSDGDPSLDHGPQRSVTGAAPPGYSPGTYLRTMDEFLRGVRRRTRVKDHHEYACWIEDSPSRVAQGGHLQMAFVFALRGMGMLVDEQQAHCRRLGLDLSRLRFLPAPVGWYPAVLPLALCRLVKAVGEIEQSSPEQVLDAIRIFSRLWHSQRVDHAQGKRCGEVKLSGLARMLDCQWYRWQEIGEVPLGQILEKHGLVECLHHPSDGERDPSTSLRYGVPAALAACGGPLVLLPPSYVPRGELEPWSEVWELPDEASDLPQECLPYLQPTPHGTAGESPTATAGTPGEDASHRRPRCQPTPWLAHPAGAAILDDEHRILARHARGARLRGGMLPAPRALSEFERAVFEARCDQHIECTCGSRRPRSRRRRRAGRTTERSLWRLRLRDPDWLTAAMLSRDADLLQAWADRASFEPLLGDLAEHQDAPPLARAAVAAILYGIGGQHLSRCAQEAGIDLSPERLAAFAEEFSRRFPVWDAWRRQVIDLGHACADLGCEAVLPCQGYLGLAPGHGSAAPAHVGQSVVRLLAAQLVGQLSKAHYRPWFEAGDVVVARAVREPGLVDDMLRDVTVDTVGKILPDTDQLGTWITTVQAVLARARFVTVVPMDWDAPGAVVFTPPEWTGSTDDPPLPPWS